MHLSTLSLSKGLLLISFLFLTACTDYVQKMDDGFDEWEQAQQQAESDPSYYNSLENTVTDSRDEQVYKTATIGNQIWMAQNLNFETKKSYCYNNNSANCAKYGRLYSWSEAMDSAGTWSSNGKGCGYYNKNSKNCSPTYPVRGICPSGWHLPTQEEWNTLCSTVGGLLVAGKMLKSTSNWYSNGNGSDDYSFSALPAGYRDNGYDSYGGEEANTYFWSSTERDRNNAYNMNLFFKQDLANLNYNNKHLGYSVRCVKDDSPTPKSSSSEVIKSSSSKQIVSSTSVVRSSSSIISSSSVNLDLTENILTDSRDNKIYKTKNIGSQTWMAENLNYKTTNSYCYNDSAKYCEKYGRLYTWATVMDSAGKWSSNGKGCSFDNKCSPTYPVRGICPSGWHLPTNNEFETLFNTVGGQSIAGEKLKSTSGWYGNIGNGTDAYSFTALPTGYRNDNGYFDYEELYTYFWSSTEASGSSAYYMRLRSTSASSDLKTIFKNNALSVRCIKD